MQNIKNDKNNHKLKGPHEKDKTIKDNVVDILEEVIKEEKNSVTNFYLKRFIFGIISLFLFVILFQLGMHLKNLYYKDSGQKEIEIKANEIFTALKKNNVELLKKIVKNIKDDGGDIYDVYSLFIYANVEFIDTNNSAKIISSYERAYKILNKIHIKNPELLDFAKITLMSTNLYYSNISKMKNILQETNDTFPFINNVIQTSLLLSNKKYKEAEDKINSLTDENLSKRNQIIKKEIIRFIQSNNKPLSKV